VLSGYEGAASVRGARPPKTGKVAVQGDSAGASRSDKRPAKSGSPTGLRVQEVRPEQAVVDSPREQKDAGAKDPRRAFGTDSESE